MFDFFKYASYILVLIGALNWGLVGLFDFDLVAFLFGEMSLLTRFVYTLIGISALVSCISLNCQNCFCNYSIYLLQKS